MIIITKKVISKILGNRYDQDHDLDERGIFLSFLQLAGY
jgi:hypothetical protein